MNHRKRLASWDLYSKRNESVVHLLEDGGATVVCTGEWAGDYSHKGESDTLAHNMKKRPCPDCLSRYSTYLRCKQQALDIEHNRLEMFSRIKRETPK